MSCPLPHVLVLLNLSRRPARLLGEAARRVVVIPSLALPSCLLRVLLSSARPLSSRLSARRAGRFGDGRRLCLRLRRTCGCHVDAMRMPCGGWLLAHRFACVPPVSIAPLPRHDWRGEERCHRCLLLSDFYRLPLALACGFDGSGLLACFYGRRPVSPCDVCGAQFL